MVFDRGKEMKLDRTIGFQTQEEPSPNGIENDTPTSLPYQKSLALFGRTINVFIQPCSFLEDIGLGYFNSKHRSLTKSPTTRFILRK